MLRNSISLILFFVIHFTCGAFAQADNNNDSGEQDSCLFGVAEPLQLTIYADFEALKSNRDKTVPYQKARLFYLNEHKDTVHVLTQVRVRGNYRLRETTCSFPPLKLKFRTRDIDSTIFKGNNRLKLVTHCQDDDVEMHHSAMREYLAYQMYNQICDNSLMVRLVNLNYIDVKTGDQIQQNGFFIEDVESMCRRVGMEEFNSLNLLMSQLSQENMIRMSMFQFMIGNNDWSLPKLHNVVVMREGQHVPPVAVPYDFDMSAFVDPPYRKSILGDHEADINYKGYRLDMELLESTIAHFKSKRSAIIDLVLDSPYLDVASKQICLQKIESFYSLFDHKSSIRRTFVSKPKS